MTDVEGDVRGGRRSAGWFMVPGLGYGFVLGLIGGFVLPTASELLVGRMNGGTLFMGVFFAPFGAVVGAIAGLAAAAAFVPFAGCRHQAIVARVVTAVVGALVVAAISRVIFQPSLHKGGNETQAHVNERLRLLYFLPCGFAAFGGLLFGGRLARDLEGETVRRAR